MMMNMALAFPSGDLLELTLEAGWDGFDLIAFCHEPGGDAGADGYAISPPLDGAGAADLGEG